MALGVAWSSHSRWSCHRGSYWSGLRAACEPMFHTSSLTSFAPLMNAAAVKLTARCLTAPVVDDESETGTKLAKPEDGAPSPDPACTGATYLAPLFHHQFIQSPTPTWTTHLFLCICPPAHLPTCLRIHPLPLIDQCYVNTRDAAP